MGIISRFEYANEAALKATIDYEKLKCQPNVPIKDWMPRFETLAEFGRANNYEKFFTHFNEPQHVQLVEAVCKLARPDINVKSNARLYFSVDQGYSYDLYCLEFVLGQRKFNSIKVWSIWLSNRSKPAYNDYVASFLGYSPLEGGITDVSKIMDDFRNKRGRFAEVDDTEETETEEIEEEDEDEEEKEREESEEEKGDEDGKEKERKKAKKSDVSDGDVDTDKEKEQESKAEENDEDGNENSPIDHNAHNIDFYVTFLDHILKHDKEPNTAYDWKEMSLNEYANQCKIGREMAEEIFRSGLACQYLKLLEFT